jgi:hypothetical protein
MADSITAQQLFDAIDAFNSAEDRMVSQLLRATGVIDPRSPSEHPWPCGDITFDWYDDSFEFKHVVDGWMAPEGFDAAVAAMGFRRYWLCFNDGTERYVALEVYDG